MKTGEVLQGVKDLSGPTRQRVTSAIVSLCSTVLGILRCPLRSLAEKMCDRYFICTDCGVVQSADQSWCHWVLEESKLVELGKTVDVERVLSCADPEPMAGERWVYRAAPALEMDQPTWLYRTVPLPIRSFLNDHRDHHIVYR